MLGQGASDLAAEASVTFAGQLRDSPGELGFDSSADVYQVLVFVDRGAYVHVLYFG